MHRRVKNNLITIIGLIKMQEMKADNEMLNLLLQKLEGRIRFLVQAAGVDVNLDIAVPCGLILNEQIANAFKHAFSDGRTGSGAGNCEINVIVNQENGMNELTVADNGVGLPADLDWEKSDTLGLRLIKMLSKQINGSIELDRSASTVFRLKFPVAV